MLVRRDIECCSGTAWQAYAAKSLQRQHWNYSIILQAVHLEVANLQRNEGASSGVERSGRNVLWEA